jgi:hypothetical protein
MVRYNRYTINEFVCMVRYNRYTINEFVCMVRYTHKQSCAQ